MLAPVDSYTFEYKQMHTCGLRGKQFVSSNSFCCKATDHYTQLHNNGNWLGQHGAKDQVVVLTTKFEEQSKQMRLLATELSKLKTSGGGDGNLGVGPKANNGRGSHWMIDE